MDINEALSALRAAFPRVTWTATEDEPGDFNIHGGPLFLWSTMGHWYCNNAVKGDPVSAVRAWLAAQPTAAFYPAPPSGETVGVRGFVVVNAAGEYYAEAGAWSADKGAARQAEAAFSDCIEDEDARRSPALPFTLRVPLPVEPPALVGEVQP